jgi:hypothetical protein
MSELRTTIVKNGVRVVVPIGLPTDGGIKDGYQVFLQKDTKQIDKHVEALTHLRDYIQKDSHILHPFAGLGVTAQVLDSGVLTHRHIMWERDPVCVEYLREQGYQVVQVDDSYRLLSEIDLSKYDAVIFDPTAGTIKAEGMVEFWDNAAKCEVETVWVTDSACSKIWLHKEHYLPELGRRVEDAHDYMLAYDHFLHQRGYVITEAWREATVVYFVAVRNLELPSFLEIVKL